MKIEEHEQLITKLLTSHQDQATLTATLQTLRDDYSLEHSAKETLVKTKTDLEKEIQTLKENNMALFLKIGTPVQDTKKPDLDEKSPDELIDEIVKGWD